MSDWIHACYTDIDAMDLPAVLDRFSADGEIVFGNNPPAVGHTAIGELLTGFWSTIAGMRHEWRHRWTVDETTAVLETRVHYTTHAGTDVTVPCVTVCERNDSASSPLCGCTSTPRPVRAHRRRGDRHRAGGPVSERLAGRVAVVTGGAAGIGRAYAGRLVRDGADAGEAVQDLRAAGRANR